MEEPNAFRAAVCLAPVRKAGQRRADSTQQPDPDGGISRASTSRIVRAALGRVEDERRCPRPKRNVGENRMQEVSEPGSVQGVLELSSRLSAGSVP